MTGDLFSDGFLLVFSIIILSIAAIRLGSLSYSVTYKKLRKRAGRMIVLLGLGMLLLIGKIIFAFVLWPGGWLRLQDKLWLHVPLLLIPIVCVVGCTLPRLAALTRDTDKDSRRKAVEPKLLIPVQATLVGAVIELYISYFTSVPLPIETNLTAITIMIGIVVLLWLRQSWRFRKAATDKWKKPKGWQRATQGFATFLIIAAGIAGWIQISVQASELPDRIGMMAHDMHNHGPTVNVTELTGPKEGVPDAKFTLKAEKKKIKLSSGEEVEAWTYNGQLPGPELRVKQGDLVEVTLLNQDIEDGVTLHWHGQDVPNAEDGVAGVTQDAVMPGQSYTYRFRANQSGTYWYHSHQASDESVRRGLFGALIVEPKTAAPSPEARDITVLAHEWKTSTGVTSAFGLNDELELQTITTGTPVKLRLINTDNEPKIIELAGTAFQVTAIDGVDMNKPTDLTDTKLKLAAGGRYDLSFNMPSTSVLLQTEQMQSKEHGLLLTPEGNRSLPQGNGTKAFDPLIYGSPANVPFDTKSHYDQTFTMVIDKKLGFYNGSFKFSFTINGKLFPDTPMFMVKEGDLVKTTIINRSNKDHPIHLHGHHMLVLSRDGEASEGSPWWTDTLNVGPGETFEVAFKADNPGIWMDHCHNLQHASVGMMMHLAYEGVTSNFEMGRATPNSPE